MTAKHNTHVAHPTPTPGQSHAPGDSAAWTLAGLFVLALPVLFVALGIAVVRFIWKRGSIRRDPAPTQQAFEQERAERGRIA